MPTYYIQLPEDGEQKALISNLIGTLEKLNGIVVFDAIGVVLQVGDAESELIRSLARDVIPERVAFSELLVGNGEGFALPELSETVVARIGNAVEQGFKESTDAVLASMQGSPSSGLVINTSSFLSPEPGVVPVSSPKRRGRPPKTGSQNAPPRKRDGSGLKQGKLVGR